MTSEPAPPRPSPFEERASARLFWALAPRLRRGPRQAAPPPPELAPFEPCRIPRQARPGSLTATFYPAAGVTRGAVLLLHPWMEWGQGYFHRRGRLESLREAGYHALTLDLSGFGGSSPPRGYLDRDVEDGLSSLGRLAPGVALHVWGVSAGGYWAHPVLARSPQVRAAFFEDVSPHLLEWSQRTAPRFRLFYRTFRRAFPRAHRYLDIRRHALAHRAVAVAYVSGELDHGVPPGDTRELARLARGHALIVPQAGHLAAIKLAGRQVVELALATFGTS